MNDPKGEDPPPFWGRWRWLYTFVVAALGIQVLLFWLLTRWAS